MNYYLASILLFISSVSMAGDEKSLDQLTEDFSVFVSAFEAKNWSQLEAYISDDTEISFGGEHGIKGFERVYINDQSCFDAMLFALKQGCKKVGQGQALECLSPPQWADADVVYLGARASFIYDNNSNKWQAAYLICGGD